MFMRLRSVVLLAVVAWAAVLVVNCGLVGSDGHHTHGSDASSAVELVAISHAFLDDCGSALSPLATAVSPAAAPALMVLGLIAASVMVAAMFAEYLRPGVRGPPRSLAGFLTGRAVVTRLCIARR